MNISDKIKKELSSVTISFKDNGYLLEASGRNDNDDWVDVNLVFTNLDQVISQIEEANIIHLSKDD